MFHESLFMGLLQIYIPGGEKKKKENSAHLTFFFFLASARES